MELARLRRKGIVNSMGFGERHLTQSENKLGFGIHAMVFVPTIEVLFIINLLIGSPYWSLWVLLGWGIGLSAIGFLSWVPAPARPKPPDAAFRAPSSSWCNGAWAS